jgi:hypothetical protein
MRKADIGDFLIIWMDAERCSEHVDQKYNSFPE